MDKRRRASAVTLLGIVVNRQLLTLATNFAIVMIRCKKKISAVFCASHAETVACDCYRDIAGL